MPSPPPSPQGVAAVAVEPHAVAVAVEPTNEEQVAVQEAAEGCRGSIEQMGCRGAEARSRV